MGSFWNFEHLKQLMISSTHRQLKYIGTYRRWEFIKSNNNTWNENNEINTRYRKLLQRSYFRTRLNKHKLLSHCNEKSNSYLLKLACVYAEQ